ncbi:MAG: hypothetical protein ACK5TR_01465 [Alphaproteobacteria bacterium]|jgi:hypothetical protein|nr:hypothetical protein [Alphaproteobacteria bacterium]
MKPYFFALSLCNVIACHATASQQTPSARPIVPSIKSKIEAIALKREGQEPRIAIQPRKQRKKRTPQPLKAGSLLKVDVSDKQGEPIDTAHAGTAASSSNSQQTSQLLAMPPEILIHIFSYVSSDLETLRSREAEDVSHLSAHEKEALKALAMKEKALRLSYRSVCKAFKTYFDEGAVYSLNLQAPAHLMQTIQFYEEKKFSLFGWVPRLSSLQERLPLSLNVKYGEVYISQLDTVDLQQHLYKNLILTWTVPTTAQIQDAQELLQEKGIRGNVRARQALWEALDATLDEDNPVDRAIRYNKDTFFPLMDLPNHEKIIRRIFAKGATEFRDTSDILAQIEDPTERTHIVSLLSKQILTNCPNISPLSFVITALAKVPNLEDRNEIVSYLSPRVLDKSKGVMGLATVIQSFSEIKTSPKRVKVASLLTDDVVSVCKNGMDLAPVIRTLGELEEEKLLPSVRVNSSLLQDCRDGKRLAETIKTSPRPLVSSGRFGHEESVF